MTIFRSCLFSRKLTLKAQEPRIFKYFIGDRESFPLEKRVLNALLLASSLLATLLVIEALVFAYSNALVLSSVAATIFWILYFVSVQLKDRDWPLWTYLFASGFIIFADWFFVGGQAGLAPLILVAISAAIPLITRKEQLKIGVLFFLVFFGVMYAFTAFYWYKIPVPTSSRKDFLVQLTEVGVLFSCLYTVAYLAISSYRREKSLISVLNLELSSKNESLEITNNELQLAFKEIKKLRGLLPTCSYCKKIRPEHIGPTEARSWVPIEKFIEQHTDAEFSHGICPDCLKDHFGEETFKKVFHVPI